MSDGTVAYPTSGRKLINMTGQRFGRLLVIRRDTAPHKGHAKWVCLCDCGTTVTVNGRSLRAGSTKSCGCYYRSRLKEKRPNRMLDLTGRRFNRLTVISRIQTDNGEPMWLCRCDCGQTIARPQDTLVSWRTFSCGCARRERNGMRTHGMSKTRIYNIWCGMIQRCETPSAGKAYIQYGKRGVTVCERWHTFENFLADMGPTYKPNLTIDRIDNNAGYFQDNCRWVTTTEQANNKRNNRMIEFRGKRLNLAQWANEVGIPQSVLRDRIVRRHWPTDTALTTPVAEPKKEHLLTYNGKTQNVCKWARETGIKHNTIRHRLEIGWSVERALTAPTRHRQKLQPDCEHHS